MYAMKVSLRLIGNNSAPHCGNAALLKVLEQRGATPEDFAALSESVWMANIKETAYPTIQFLMERGCKFPPVLFEKIFTQSQYTFLGLISEDFFAKSLPSILNSKGQSPMIIWALRADGDLMDVFVACLGPLLFPFSISLGKRYCQHLLKVDTLQQMIRGLSFPHISVL